MLYVDFETFAVGSEAFFESLLPQTATEFYIISIQIPQRDVSRQPDYN